ncbi:hypothetical protein [Halorientalis sp.]|jgi:hypothetical protein|uniref:hypothetical protein n=1 Tax=Halorientalis sp. TaxID=1931229 RepID=UPI002604B703|nr:hypothetical protein [Halorientalis sp.]
MTEALLAPFDEDLLATVAGRHDTDEATLRDLLRRHQQQVRDNPGVEDIVYEWRSQFHGQPVLRRTEDTYYLRLHTHVWDEFAAALDIPEASLHAVLDTHEEQLRRETGASVGDDERAMVLNRP